MTHRSDVRLADLPWPAVEAALADGTRTAVLMVEQNAKEALRRCDRGYVLVNGGNRYTDRGEVLLGDEDVRRDFLGG